MKPHTYSFFGELFASRNVLWQLVAQQLILRYRRTALGYLWTLINPLLMMSIMALVFSTLFNADLKTFAVFLFTGMIPWNFFSSVVTQSGTSFINNEGLIKKIYLPKIIFPLSITSALLIDTVFSFFALFIIILTLGSPLSWAVLFIPIAFLLLFLFTLGIGLITSIATVYFRDLQYVILIIMQALFFLTPILYKPDALKGKVAWLITLNPVVPFIDLFRAPLYLGSLPSQSSIILSILFSLVSITIGLIIFLWQEKKIVFRL
ncbi:MAG TPA: ABC transporter permease [Porticoccus sp.]|nr:ABC transporter permease [Porticoccus sp.]